MILPENLMNLIHQGEGLTVEFKKSTTDITKDVYDTVCSFSNREGGHIFFGVKDTGAIHGVDKDCIEQMKKNFVTTINNENKMYPPLYLTPEEYEIDGLTVLYVYVPVGKTVYRNAGRIFDRNNESDIDITDNADMVFNLYARKQSTYFVNKVYPAIPVSSLRHDLMDRARRMTRMNTEHHPWVDMTDEEMLRSCGLILEDPETNKEGITLAAILLFGTDNRIMSVLPQHKTDAIFRVFNVDRYDDRDVVVTNLIESYDRLMEFGKKHLNDVFTLDGIQRVSARDKILREIISNLLMHRDFSSGYVPKLVIERDKLTIENANLAHGHGNLNLKTFRPFAKNPPIAKVFREIGLADELGSGMRNSYKYTKMYSGGEPVFTEADIFTTVIPLSEAATATVGPTEDFAPREQVKEQVKEQVTIQDLIQFCSIPRSRKEMQEFMGLAGRRNFSEKYIKPLLEAGKIKMTIPDKPNSRNQKYQKVNSEGKGHVSLVTKDEGENLITLYTPSLEDLWFRQKMMADTETMSYNQAWGGTIPFPKEEWRGWYDYWIVNHEGKRYYRYLKDKAGHFVGELAYHYDNDRKLYLADIIVYAPYRKKGYGGIGLDLLCNAAKQNGVKLLYDDIAIDNPAITMFLQNGFREEYRTHEIIMLKKEL